MNEQTSNIKFVQEVEKHPCLYNYTLTDYSRKDVTERAWSKVGKIFGLNSSQSKEKWKNLRAVFVRNTKPAPSGSSSRSKKPYYMSDAMQFTIPYIKALNNVIPVNLPQAAQGVTEQEDNTEINESKSILRPQNVSSPFQDIPLHISQSSRISDQPLSTMSCPPSRPSAHSTDICSNHLRRTASSTVDDVIMEYFKAKKAKLEKKSDEAEDPKRMFLLSLLPDMNQMSDSQTRAFKRRVLAIVDEILEEPPRALNNHTDGNI